jgi:hypothetical protein
MYSDFNLAYRMLRMVEGSTIKLSPSTLYLANPSPEFVHKIQA